MCIYVYITNIYITSVYKRIDHTISYLFIFSIVVDVDKHMKKNIDESAPVHLPLLLFGQVFEVDRGQGVINGCRPWSLLGKS